MTTEDFYAFGCQYLGVYCPELSKPPSAVCFRNSRGSVSSIDTTTGEITFGNTPGGITVMYTREFSDEMETRKGNSGRDERTISEEYIAEIETYRWDEEPALPAQPQPQAAEQNEHPKLLSSKNVATAPPAQPDIGEATERDELKPDRNEAERFLTALSTNKLTYQTFDDNKERRKKRAEANKQRAEENKLRKQQGKRQLPKIRDPFARIFHGTLTEHWDELVELNNKGAGVYFTVCETDLTGRKKENIKRVRAGFGDLDGAPLEPVNEAKLLPHIINETSPGRYHPYYIIGDDMPLDRFEPLQKTIAARFNGDLSVHDLPRVMRLPGFVHRKGEPFLVRIQQINKIAPYPWKTLQEAFLPPTPDALSDTKNGASNNDSQVAPKFRGLPVQDLVEGMSDHLGRDLSGQWKKLNSEAIRRYSDWVPDIFPTARPSNGGYRVSSVDLNRDLEEDLSFHPDG